MSDRVLMEEMTWPEVKAALDSGAQTAIIPTASVEQHGPHLPLLTDTIIGGRVVHHLPGDLPYRDRRGLRLAGDAWFQNYHPDFGAWRKLHLSRRDRSLSARLAPPRRLAGPHCAARQSTALFPYPAKLLG